MGNDKITTGLSFDEYRAIKAVNFSTLKAMAVSPLKYRHVVDVGVDDKPHWKLGRVAHTAVLEPFSWAERYIIRPEEVTRETTNKRTGEVKTETVKPNKKSPELVELQKTATATGREIISRADHDKAVAISRAVLLNEMTANIFRQKPLTEVTVQWEFRGVPVKSRIDIVIPGVCIIDLKSTCEIEPEPFDASVIKHHYLEQGAFYQDAWFYKTGEMLPFLSIPVESSAPHDVDLVEFDESELDQGRTNYQGWFAKLIECQKTGYWPGVNSTKKPRKFKRPHWAIPYEDDEIKVA